MRKKCHPFPLYVSGRALLLFLTHVCVVILQENVAGDATSFTKCQKTCKSVAAAQTTSKHPRLCTTINCLKKIILKYYNVDGVFYE